MTSARVLFDEPGPRAARRIRLATAATGAGIIALIWLGVQQFAAHGQLSAQKWQPFTSWPYLRFLLQGLGHTIEAAALAMAVSVPLGALFALGRLSRSRPVRVLAAAYVEVLRSVPLLLLIFFFLLGLPRFGITLPPFWLLVLPLIISNAATLAEIFRAGIQSLDRGQSDAAYSIGLSYWQTMLVVLIPQALRQLLPTMVSQLVALLKGTSLGYVVSYGELLQSGRVLGEYTQTLVQTYIVVALFYVAVNLTLSRLATTLEARQRRRGRGAAVLVAAAEDVGLTAQEASSAQPASGVGPSRVGS